MLISHNRWEEDDDLMKHLISYSTWPDTGVESYSKNIIQVNPRVTDPTYSFGVNLDYVNIRGCIPRFTFTWVDEYSQEGPLNLLSW